MGFLSAFIQNKFQTAIYFKANHASNVVKNLTLRNYFPDSLKVMFFTDSTTGFITIFFTTTWDNIFLETLFQASSPVAHPTIFPNFSHEKSEPFFQGKFSHLLRRGIEGNMPIITQLIEAKVQLGLRHAFCLGVQYTLLGGRKTITMLIRDL